MLCKIAQWGLAVKQAMLSSGAAISRHPLP